MSHSYQLKKLTTIAQWCILYTLTFPTDINRVQLLGRVGNDPEERGDARPIVYFPLATSHTIKVMGDGDECESSACCSRVVVVVMVVVMVE